MEREIIELRRKVANGQTGTASTPHPQQQQQQQQSAQQSAHATPKQESAHVSPSGTYQTPSAISSDQYMGSQEAVASLLDLRSGFDSSNYMRSGSQLKRIEDVMVIPEKATELFNLYVSFFLLELLVALT